jgi:hypothetical protein
MSSTIVGNLAVELGVSDAQLQAGLAQAVTQSQVAGQKMANAINQGMKSTSGGGMNPQGLLNISRAIDDVQYGFRGIVNNIEGIVTGLGGTAALAGGITIAAVAINTFGDDIASAFDKVIDGRNEMQKLADQTRYAASIFGELEARITTTSSRLKTLADSDAGAGIGGFVRRNAGYDTASMNEQSRSLFAQLSEQMMFDSRQSAKNRSATDAGLNFLDPGQDPDKMRMRAEATRRALPNEFQRNLAFGKLTDQLAKDEFGGDFTRARQRARELIGQATLGIEEGFKALNKIGNGKLEAERIRVLAENIAAAKDDFDRATGATEEFARMDRAAQKSMDERISEHERASSRQNDLFKRRDEIMLQRSRSEILGSAAEVFGRNINAGQEDPQLKELKEINEGIKNLGNWTGLG